MECSVCGGKSDITWMGFAVMDFCTHCYETRRDECDKVYAKSSDELVARESTLPKVEYCEINIDQDNFQHLVQNKQEPELEQSFKDIAAQVYELKVTKLHCNKNWRYLWYDKEEGKNAFVDQSIPFLYDRLKVYNSDTSALDYFVAAVCHVYEQAKLKNWQDWAY